MSLKDYSRLIDAGVATGEHWRYYSPRCAQLDNYQSYNRKLADWFVNSSGIGIPGSALWDLHNALADGLPIENLPIPLRQKLGTWKSNMSGVHQALHIALDEEAHRAGATVLKQPNTKPWQLSVIGAPPSDPHQQTLWSLAFGFLGKYRKAELRIPAAFIYVLAESTQATHLSPSQSILGSKVPAINDLIRVTAKLLRKDQLNRNIPRNSEARTRANVRHLMRKELEEFCELIGACCEELARRDQDKRRVGLAAISEHFRIGVNAAQNGALCQVTTEKLLEQIDVSLYLTQATFHSQVFFVPEPRSEHLTPTEARDFEDFPVAPSTLGYNQSLSLGLVNRADIGVAFRDSAADYFHLRALLHADGPEAFASDTPRIQAVTVTGANPDGESILHVGLEDEHNKLGPMIPVRVDSLAGTPLGYAVRRLSTGISRRHGSLESRGIILGDL